jgi:hypothetical protein
MIIRPFRQGEEAALRQVFFSAVHEIASRDYTSEQIEAWAPTGASAGARNSSAPGGWRRAPTAASMWPTA